MKFATKPQIQKIYTLLHKYGADTDKKKDLVFEVTKGRTVSCRELYINEASYIIKKLAKLENVFRLQCSIVTMAYRAGIIYGNTKEDVKMNEAKLNLFLRERGAVKKDLAVMTYPELLKVQKQFEAMAIKVQANQAKKAHEKQVDALLRELNLQTA